MADATNVGGPNQDAARFAYPGGPSAKQINYNYKDTVVIEWYSYAANDSDTTMQIWYSPSNAAPGDKWKAMTKKVVPVNGTLSYNLGDDIDKIDGGSYIGQWNLNFTRADKQPATGLTLSTQFKCTFDDSKEATTYSRAVSTSTSTSAPSSSATSASSTSAATASTSATGAPTGPTTGVLSANAADPSSTATPASHSLSGGAIAGIIIAILAAVALGALGAFFFLRRKRANKDQVPANAAPGPYGPATPHSQYQPGGDMYKQQMAGYPGPGPGAMSPAGMAPMAAAGHYAPQSQKAGYVATEQQYGGMHGYPQNAGYPQANGFVSELPVDYQQQHGSGTASPAQPPAAVIRQELPTERYS